MFKQHHILGILKVQMESQRCEHLRNYVVNDVRTWINSEIRMRDVITNYIYPILLAVLKVSSAEA